MKTIKLKCWDCRNKKYCKHTQNEKVKLNLNGNMEEVNKIIEEEINKKEFLK